MAQNAASQPLTPHRHAGRFQPGVSGNPNGRPTLPREVRQLLEDAAPTAVKRIIELVGSKDEKVAAACSEMILNRLYGKPTQNVDAKVERTDIGQMHLAALQKIMADTTRAKQHSTIHDAPGTGNVIDITPAADAQDADAIVATIVAADEADAPDGNDN